jgi:D-arginine dehydrogenase
VANETVDVLVVGAGIAGLSAAAALSTDRSVLVVERFGSPATQTTGRSAAQFIVDYGGPTIRPFTAASRTWYLDGGGHARQPLRSLRGMLVVAGDDVDELAGYRAGGLEVLSPAQAGELFPSLRQDRVVAAVHEPQSDDIDVAEAVASFRRALSTAGGIVRCDEQFVSATRDGDAWRAETINGTISAGIIVNAAGAWADEVAVSCRLPPIGLVPMRRTACTFRSLDDSHHASPFLSDAASTWYLKPEAGGFMASPSDETPSAPCDARPEEIDIALTIDRVNEFTTLAVRSITSSWAGLRTFSADRGLVLGPDPLQPSFVWSAGQGGYGIQTAPAASATVAALVRGGLTTELVDAGITLAIASPARFRQV